MSDRLTLKSKPLAAVLCMLSLLLTAQSVQAQGYGQAMENVLVSRQDDAAILKFLPRCPMRYRVHSPSTGGTSLRIQVMLGTECRALLEESFSEQIEPPGHLTGDIQSIRFDARSRWNAAITIDFRQSRQFSVTSANNGWIEIRLDMSRAAEEFASAVPDPLPPPLAIPEPSPTDSTFGAPAADGSRISNRGPSQRRTWTQEAEQFAVQIGIFENPSSALTVLGNQYSQLNASQRELVVNGTQWHEVYVGPYPTELAANEALRSLRARFPDSWVRVFSDFDASTVATTALGSEEKLNATEVISGASLSEAKIATKMRAAREAMLAKNYSKAIHNYQSLLEVENHEQRDLAREYLGVALERDLQHEQAIVEYQAWLNEFPEHPARERVQTRLNGLRNRTATASQTPLIIDTPSQASALEWRGGFSQLYRRDIAQFVDNGEGIQTASALYNYGDFTLRRQGERFDVLARASGSYVMDLNDNARRNVDTGWLADAFVKVADAKLNLDASLGRQRTRGRGVLSRFDGLALDYRWRDDVSLGFVGGVPVDTTRYISNRERYFYGLSATLHNVIDRVDVELYTHQQTAEGLSDREAIGAEVQYNSTDWSVFGLLDYDWSYNVLNTFLVSGYWQVNDRITLNATVETGKQTVITTRNALAGQTARQLSELQSSYSNAQLRTLAIDRTPDASHASIGIALPINEQFRFSVDFATRENEASMASGGVAALPASGRQTYLTTILSSTSLLREGDLSRVVLRRDQTRTTQTQRIQLDTRLPFGEFLRVSPELNYTQRKILLDGSTQTIVEPAIRVFYRWRKRVLFEMEAGGRYSTRELPAELFDPFIVDGEEELIGSYVNIGYRMEF